MNQLPQDIELEAAVIGQIVNINGSFELVADKLNEDCFYHDPHKILFRCIKWLSENNMPIDLLTVTNAIKQNGYYDRIGGAYFIAGLSDGMGLGDHITNHAEILIEHATKRQIITICNSTLNEAYNPSIKASDLIDKYEKNLTKVTTDITGDKILTSADLHQQLLQRNELILKNEGKPIGIQSGFTVLDRVTGGWQNPDLIIVAGRPSMGKTAVAIQFAANPAIKQNKPVAIFSLEMSSLQLYSRMQSQQSGVSNDKITRTGLQTFDISQLSPGLEKSNIFYDDTPAISIFEFRNKARKLKREEGIELIVIDYLQLMTAGKDFKGNREQEISYISRSLKVIAKELNIPIIALSQLSRNVEGRKTTDFKPQLSDLRESGAIEQDADIVIFIHRAEYYGIKADAGGNSTAGKAEFVIAKHRNGSLAEIPVNFEHGKTLFSDYVQVAGIYSGTEGF